MTMTAQIDQSERLLVERIKEGDHAAFRNLVESMKDRVLNLCYRMTGNRMDAEDLSQEVFVDVYKHIDSFRGDASLKSWILRIAHNKSLNYLRDSRRSSAVSLDSATNDSQSTIADTIAGKDSDRPDRSLEIERSREILNAALARLPGKLAQPFTLHKLDGMSYDEIAAFLGMSVSAVESQIHRAKLRLQKELSKMLIQ
jgi:RNA polymerase sigma-70 factor (ECF subfamily)